MPWGFVTSTTDCVIQFVHKQVALEIVAFFDGNLARLDWPPSKASEAGRGEAPACPVAAGCSRECEMVP